MNLYSANPRTGTRRQVKGPYLAIAAGVLIIAGATAGTLGLRSTSQGARPATRSLAGSQQPTAFAGTGHTDTMGGYADYLQSRLPLPASTSTGGNDHAGGMAEQITLQRALATERASTAPESDAGTSAPLSCTALAVAGLCQN